MKNREYISPSAIATWNNDGDEAFYMKYLSDIRLEGEPQTQPMSIGSAFDAYAKSYLYEKLFGKGHNPQFDFEAIFETQVEEHNRTWARVHGKQCFENYVASGALNDLLVDLSQASGTPRFEFEVRGGVKSKVMDPKGLVLLGKPDCYYRNKHDHPVILDWKINGWCGKSNKSPAPGYVRLRHCDGTSPKNLSHKDAVLGTKHGVTVNLAKRLEDVDASWAGQLAVYGWLCGEEVGNEFITIIHQAVCKPTAGFPEVRFAEHCTWVSPEYQHAYLEKAVEIWEIIHSDHIFRSLSREESAIRCRTLDHFTEFAASGTGNTEEDKYFKEMTKTKTWY
jgi:hypothetical protein